jgi:hypothetical protein
VSVWFFIEAACIAIFTLELGIRLLVCPNKLKFVSEWMNLIDFLAVLPFYLEVPCCRLPSLLSSPVRPIPIDYHPRLYSRPPPHLYI